MKFKQNITLFEYFKMDSKVIYNSNNNGVE